MALVDVGGDPWQSEFDSCERLFRDLVEKTTERNKQQRGSTQHTRLSAVIRQELKQFSTQVQQLQEHLDSSLHHLTEREAERRNRLLESLASKEKHLEQLFSQRGNGYNDNRAHLLGGQGIADLGITGWGVEETEDTQEMSTDELRQHQQQILHEQDAGLEALSVVISKQKHVAEAIGDEVDVQNELIDDIADTMDTTNKRLMKETRHVKIISIKDGTFYWVVIVFLLIAIIVVVAIPKQ